MSNFLQRVATAAIQPQTRLRPILGSVFAPPALRLSKDVLPTEVETASQTLAPHHQEPAPLSAFNTSIPVDRDRLLPTIVQEEYSPVRSHTSLSNDPLLLPAFNSPDELRKSTQEHPFIEDSNQPSESLKPTTSNQQPIAVVQQPALKPQPYQPLIAAMQQPSPRLQPHEPMPTSAMVRSSRAEATRRAQSAQREPDEVHIHIGRIEVAAFTQQTPRPAAAAARRSLNLGDYLKHNNGRSG